MVIWLAQDNFYEFDLCSIAYMKIEFNALQKIYDWNFFPEVLALSSVKGKLKRAVVNSVVLAINAIYIFTYVLRHICNDEGPLLI